MNPSVQLCHTGYEPHDAKTMGTIMKKLLLASSALVLSAGVAAAEFTIGGNARAGITYVEDRANAAGVLQSETQVDMRLRFNIDAKKELDSGVTLGGRIRMQYDDNNAGAGLSAAMLYAETGGLRVEVGNVNTALDSMALLYNAELGYIGTTLGGYAQATYAAFENGAYSGTPNRMGLFASYSVGDLVARVSYVTPDQVSKTLAAGTKEELSLSLDYKAGAFSFGLGVAQNGGFVDGNDVYAVTGEYAINDTTAVGLQYVDNGSAGVVDNGNTTTLYGRTAFSGVGVGAYIASLDGTTVAPVEDISFGLGFDYDLGGATLAGTVQRGFDDKTYADLGIRFTF
jgi:outer membrane protein OmpU